MFATFQTLSDLSMDAAKCDWPDRADPMFAAHMRNHALDAVFYDVGALSRAEVDYVLACRRAEGSILVVRPEPDSGVALIGSAQDFLRKGPDAPRALVVAGVGSSALGTAALARNVAQATGKPVAGVVSGYGMHDLLFEALGGWFWYRTMNKLHHHANSSLNGFGKQDRMARFGNVLSPDTATLKDLFLAPEPAFDLIAGHSKGNLTIAEALYQAEATGEAGPQALLATAHIITISAAIYMPERAKRVTDIIGQIDWFGRINSHPDVEPDIEVPGAWHHTNTSSFTGLDVTKAIKTALALGA